MAAAAAVTHLLSQGLDYSAENGDYFNEEMPRLLEQCMLMLDPQETALRQQLQHTIRSYSSALRRLRRRRRAQYIAGYTSVGVEWGSEWGSGHMYGAREAGHIFGNNTEDAGPANLNEDNDDGAFNSTAFNDSIFVNGSDEGEESAPAIVNASTARTAPLLRPP